MRKSLLALSVISTMLAGNACTVSQQTAPSVSGPSELAMSLSMTAIPDTVVQDGSGTSTVRVTAFDAGGHLISVDVQLALSGTGTLSSGTVKTGTDPKNPAFVLYTPPIATSGAPNVVTITGSVIAANSTNNASVAQGLPVANPQVFITIRPASAVIASAPAASFKTSVFAPAQQFAIGQLINFDASASCGTQLVGGVCPGTSAIVSYVWNFGDSLVGSGVTTTHTYSAAGTYTAQLTIVNDRGLLGSASQSIVIPAAVDPPTAAFVVSPNPVSHTTGTAFFNGATSTAASGHGIVNYAWNFGDGNSATGTSATQSHIYGAAGSYTATLTVTDDLGQTKTTTGTITVT